MTEISWCIFDLVHPRAVAVLDELLARPMLLNGHVANPPPFLARNMSEVILGAIVERLARPDAVKLLRKKVYDTAEAEKLRAEEQLLLERIGQVADERADGLLTGEQAHRATERIREKLRSIVNQQQDQDRLRVLDGIPLGTDDVAAAVEAPSPDRLRAVIRLLMSVSVAPVGKGGHVFNPDRVAVDWK